MGYVRFLRRGVVALLCSSVLAGCAAAAVPNYTPRASDSDREMARLTCPYLGDQAVRLSTEDEKDRTLVKVRKTEVLSDHRDDYGSHTRGKRLVLACEGLGVWANGDRTLVRVHALVDAHGHCIVRYQSLSEEHPQSSSGRQQYG